MCNNNKSDEEVRSKIRETRAERYYLQSFARTILWAKGKKKGYVYPQNFHRTAKCCHVRHSEYVDVLKSKEHNKAFYAGLVVCASTWACPVCSAKIQEKRRIEIAKGFDWAYKNGKKVIMVTFTIPHNKNQSLQFLLEKHQDALRRLRQGKVWGKIKLRNGFEGLIRSLEVTYGENGWHVHTHEAWIVDKNCKVRDLKKDILKRWYRFCDAIGLIENTKKAKRSFLKYSVDLMNNCSTSDYLAKQDDSKNWGVDRELAKSSSKRKKVNKGLHQFGFLSLIAECEENGDEKEKRRNQFLYLNFVEKMKGKSQIFWSPGLKEKVGLKDKTDQEIAEEQDDYADILGSLDKFDWAVVVKNNLKSKLLDAAETGGVDGVKNLLNHYATDEVYSAEQGNITTVQETSQTGREVDGLIIEQRNRKEKILYEPKVYDKFKLNDETIKDEFLFEKFKRKQNYLENKEKEVKSIIEQEVKKDELFENIFSCKS